MLFVNFTVRPTIHQEHKNTETDLKAHFKHCKEATWCNQTLHSAKAQTEEKTQVKNVVASSEILVFYYAEILDF